MSKLIYCNRIFEEREESMLIETASGRVILVPLSEVDKIVRLKDSTAEITVTNRFARQEELA